MSVWVDTETTGLDPERGDLLEVALVVTDDDLAEVAATASVVQPIAPMSAVAWMKSLSPIIQEMHGKNGLFDEIMDGHSAHLHVVEDALCAWVGAAAKERLFDLKKTPLAGSTVGFDRAWLRRHMPRLEALFSYRSIDVSSFTEIARRWAPAIYDGKPRAKPEEIVHRALPDVLRESIAILRYYRESGFVGGAK